ncbi:DUF943 family protein [Tatumella sp. OPLPL6]|uniref:DUF943 family protein n=1 Tax=Tatumella sp. OPLPL6 TaxID=1928657 RepID=UPI000C197794|nr:DUF943 family protein [Tatumella sp. OPLPL6]PIJ43728.1 hypothetical protein BOM24_06870 [Tatumella sp. OPLPL6]
MRKRNKTAIIFLTLAISVLLIFTLWISLRKVEVVAVYKEGDFISILVNNFPLTDSGKISWWLKNRNTLQEKYNLPQPYQKTFSSIVFWDFAEGYKEQGKYDRRCFDGREPPLNCIEKNIILTIWNSPKGVQIISVDNGQYTLNESEIITRN